MTTKSTGRAVVVGATGQIGRAAVRALAEEGFEVVAASRGGSIDGLSAGVTAARLDREDDAALAAVVAGGCDVLVDVVAYGATHARQLTALADRVGSAVVVSSAAVYEDAQGRSFDTQSEPDGFPRWPVPLPETQRTVAPGESSYATRKVLLERELLAAGDRLPVTVLRAGAVHGPHCRTPRELYFVKRLLDGRERRVLAYGGVSRFHPVHTSNLAELVRLAALRPGTRVLNAGDPDAPTVAAIGTAIDAVMGVGTRTETPAGPPGPDGVGDTPWSVPHPVVLDMAEAGRRLGYRPLTTYADSLPETVGWLRSRLRQGPWTEVFPELARQYGAGRGGIFDYAAEDAWLAAHDAAGGAARSGHA